MAAGAAHRSGIRAPGRIILNPTDLGDASTNYGGTEIGWANLCVLQPLGTAFHVEYEGLGEVGDVLEANKRYVFACLLRGWDDDAVRLMLANGYTAGGVSQHAAWSEPSTDVPGSSAISRAVILLYVPDDVIHVPALLVYRGIPDWTDGAELAFQRGEELGIPITVDCLRDANGNMLTVRRLSDMSLT